MKDTIYRQDAIDELMKRDKALRNINWYDKPFAEGECKGIDDALEIINALPSAQSEPSQVARDIATIVENEQDMRVMLSQQWIPVSERLPEELTTVLITDKDGDVFVARFIEVINGCAEWSTDDVIAWMLRPEPYKEKVEDE